MLHRSMVTHAQARRNAAAQTNEELRQVTLSRTQYDQAFQKT